MTIQVSSQFSRRVTVEVGDHQTPDALLSETPTQAGADAAGATRDDDNFIPQLHAQAA